jgi:hypothetical protein
MFGEIMDGSFRTIRRNARSMLSSALIVQAVSAVLVGAMAGYAVVMSASLEETGTLSNEPNLGPMLGFMAGILVVSVLTVFLSAVLQGVMSVPVSRSVLNRRTGFGQMWSLARSRIWTLVGLAGLLLLAVVAGFAVFVGLILLLVAAVGSAGGLLALPLGLGAIVLTAWLYVKFLVAPAAAVVEDIGVLDALRRSWQLTKYNWWRIFGMTLVVSIMISIIGQVVLIPFSLATGGIAAVILPHGGAEQLSAMAIIMTVAGVAVGALVGAVGFAFQTSVMALIYLDLRMRHDGLDVELLRLAETGADANGIPGRRPHDSPGLQGQFPYGTGRFTG